LRFRFIETGAVN